MKQKLDIGKTIIILLLGLMFVTSILMVKTIRESSTKCIANPLIYGLERIDKDNKASTVCTCNLNKQNSQSFIVTSKGYRPVASSGYHFEMNLNYSKLGDLLRP
jgi:hypothetical protein